MKTLHRNKRPLYICELYQDNNLKKYKEPVKLNENWQVIYTSEEFKNVGQEVYDTVRIRTSVDHAKYYHLGDRAYIFVQPPSEHDVYCKTADYQVFADPIVTLNECQVILKKLSGKGVQNIYR